MIRRVWIIALALLLCIAQLSAAYAHTNAAEHWSDIRAVLFGNSNYKGAGKAKDALDALLYASQLCIDQFESGGKSHLDRLKKLGKQFNIAGLPTDISEIALFPLHNNHRAYTHQGWNFNYQKYDDKRNSDWSSVRWPKRKKLLLNTAEAIFNFNGVPRFLDRFLDADQKCDAFCRLLYCVHMLGDHIECTSRRQYEKSKKELMPLATMSSDSILSELNACLPILFPKQNVSALKKELNLIQSEILSLLNQSDDCSTDEAIKQYKALAEKTLNVLSEHLPRLLENEEFFSKIFHS